jgi:homoserine kinase
MEQGAQVVAFAPGSVGNLGSGFDVLGMALENPGDQVLARPGSRRGVVLTRIHGADERLRAASGENTAVVAARTLLERSGRSSGSVEMELTKGLPLSAGMGGSAASAVAAVVAVNELLGLGAGTPDLLQAALAGEAAAAGAAHPDNAAPSLLGGVVLVRGQGIAQDVVSLPVPRGLTVALVHPHMEIDTSHGRSVLPNEIALSTGVAQWANVGAVVAALHSGDLDLLGRGLEDHVAEPFRAPLIPGFGAVKRSAMEAGALGCSISGSGPSVFALCRDLESAERAGAAMQRAFLEQAELAADVHVGAAGGPGARIVSRSSGA